MDNDDLVLGRKSHKSSNGEIYLASNFCTQHRIYSCRYHPSKNNIFTQSSINYLWDDFWFRKRCLKI